MGRIKNIRLLPVLMALTILAITAFQVYWLNKTYERERRTLDMRTNFLFRETVFNLQGAKLKLDSLSGDSARTKILLHADSGKPVRIRKSNQKMVNMVDILLKKARDTARPQDRDSIQVYNRMPGRKSRLMQFLFEIDSLQDSVTIKELETAYAKRLEEQNITVPFNILRVSENEKEESSFHQVTLGFSRPITYQLELGNRGPYLLKRILVPILFSIFLVGFTTVSFTVLYRNVLHQRKLANIKNEFISNITHELKTPIATVSVAIEALRSFNASLDPAKTKEYLDISANELQRLSLLVDKVLKLSMFEKKEIELKYESLDMNQLVDEVTSSMRLQFEKNNAKVNVTAEGDTGLEGDRLHLVSVIFNLIDNALKYSSEHPEIDISIKGGPSFVDLYIADTGIGISQEYHHRIFEKFFRVPTGNLHNAKGYGLGLSYVSHVVKKHRGTIKVESKEGNGSKFHISLPKHPDKNIS